MLGKHVFGYDFDWSGSSKSPAVGLDIAQMNHEFHNIVVTSDLSRLHWMC
jgi:hypothetical protein